MDHGVSAITPFGFSLIVGMLLFAELHLVVAGEKDNEHQQYDDHDGDDHNNARHVAVLVGAQ